MRNALTFKVKGEVISENPLTINVVVVLHKYLSTNIVFNQASENQPRTRRRSRKETLRGEPDRGSKIRTNGIVWNPFRTT